MKEKKRKSKILCKCTQGPIYCKIPPPPPPGNIRGGYQPMSFGGKNMKRQRGKEGKCKRKRKKGKKGGKGKENEKRGNKSVN